MKTIYSWRAKKFPAPKKREKLKRLIQKTAEECGLDLAENDVAAVYFVGANAIKRINKEYVGHEGVTDVICFDYRETDRIPGEETAVEIFISPDAAEGEAIKRENSSYADEIALYIVHGMLHASGEDDLVPEKKRKMRRREKKVVGELKKFFDFSEIFTKE